MVKDYAKYAAAQYEPAKNGIPVKGLLGLVVVVAIALVVFFHPWKPDEVVKGQTQDLTVVNAAPVPVVSASQIDQPTFDFYDILTSSDDEMVGASSQAKVSPVPASKTKAPVVNVTKPKKAVTAPAKKVAKSTPKKTAAKKAGTASQRYIISLGEYKKYEDAQKHRAALILSGLDVKLAKVGSKYRLETGPYENWREAHAAQLSLEQQQQIRGKIVQ